MDYASELLDEIALEGLDGITIDGLWLRLSRRPSFICADQVETDEKVKSFVWSIVRRLRDVEFHHLDTPRKPLVVPDPYKVDPDLGIISEPISVSDDLYPHELINEDGVLGSCSTYKTRENITSKVRTLDLIRTQLFYGNSLVIVASQATRQKALIGQYANPNLEISPIQFCILERIGRSRYHGESTQGKLGLAAVGEDAKTIFYLRKYLLKHNLIKKQCFQQKSSLNHSGLLLHLTRFYCLFKPRYVMLIENIIRIIKKEPNNYIDYNVLRKKVPALTKKMTKILYFRKYLRTDIKLPYRTVYPDSSEKEWKQRSCDKERIVRVISLLDPNIEVEDVHRSLLGEDEDDDDEKGGILEDGNRYLDVPLLTQCSMVLRGHGQEGLSQSEIAKRMGLQKVQARTTTKNLIRTGAAVMYMVDIGRQRYGKFYLKHNSEINDMDPQTSVYTKNLSDTLNSSLDSVNEDKLNSTFDETSITQQEISEPDQASPCSDKPDDFKPITRKRRKILEVSSESPQDNRKKIKSNNDDDAYDNLVKCNQSDDILKENMNDSCINKNLNNDNFSVLADESKMDVSETDANAKNTIEPESENAVKEVVDRKSEMANSIDADTLNITVSMSDDYQWLLPKVGENKRERIREKSLNTLRLLKRSNLIIEAVHEYRIISDMKRLSLLINKSEFNEGLGCRMDKKSLLRILFKLASNNHVKIYRATLNNGTDELHLSFICEPHVKPDDPVIKSTVELNKVKFQSVNRVKQTASISSPRKQTSITYEKRNSLIHIPKFNRMSVLHKFLFYLVYDYNGVEMLDQEMARQKIGKQTQGGDEITDWPNLYLSTLDERMFVPPLPKYTEQGQTSGWCLLSDILLRLPVSIFVQLIQIPYFIPELDDYLNHPIKKFFLVSSLPVKIRNCMTATRKYIFSVFDIVVKLAYTGLIQFSANQNKEKDQIFVFVNRNTVLIDTTSSKPGYNTVSPDIDYPVYTYRFDSLQNVHDYWHNCWKICMNTKLGVRSQVMGTDVVMENIQDKHEMVDATRPRDFADAPDYDNGYVPGDKLGAAGFDSALFSHLKRNWFCKTILESSGFGNTKVLQSKKLSNPVPSVKKSVLKSTRALDKSVEKENDSLKSLKEKTNLLGKQISKPRVRKTVNIRRINPVNKSLRRKPYYDQVDREALKRMSKLRVDWSAEEDRILLICKIASTFLCSDSRKQLNANIFLTYREVLHRLLQSSKNKTSRACQRRVTYMLRSASTRHNVHLCVEELKRDEYITGKYSHIFELVTQEARTTGKKISDMGEVWREHFKGLVNELINRYDNNDNISFHNIVRSHSIDFMLPNTLTEFHETYNLQQIEKTEFRPRDVYKPITNINDIYSSVINSTIHSTLSCNSDKTSWSYHLFSIYQQYPEKLLRNALNRLRGNQMVSFRKSYQIRSREQRKTLYLPLSASPYQLSISYFNLMQTKYQSNLYLDCYKTFNELFNSRNVMEDDNALQKGFELLSQTGGSAAAIVELFSNSILEFMIDIPDQVIILDPDVKLKDETYSRLVQRYEDILKINNKDLTLSVLFQKHNYSMNVDEVNSDDSMDDKEKTESADKSNDKELCVIKPNTHVMQNVAKASSRIALHLMDESHGNQKGLIPKEVDHVYDFFVVNSCKIFAKLRSIDKLENDENSVIDNETVQDIVKTVRNSANFHNIEPAVKLDENEDDEYKIEEHDDAKLDEIVHDTFPDDEIDLVKSILGAAKTEGVFGLTNEQLLNVCGNGYKAVEVMNKLIGLYFILKTGVAQTRYVYYTFARPWLLCSFRNCRGDKDARTPLYLGKSIKTVGAPYIGEITDDENDHNNSLSEEDSNDKETVATAEDCNSSDSWKFKKEHHKELLKNQKMAEPIKVIIKPWIRVDGTLNRRVLDALLISTLSQIMLDPGISLTQVQRRFAPAFQPVHLREACDILLKLNCVVQFCVKVEGKRSLSSKPSTVLVEPSSGLESGDSIRFETTRFAIINLGKFLETRPYRKSLFECSLER